MIFPDSRRLIRKIAVNCVNSCCWTPSSRCTSCSLVENRTDSPEKREHRSESRVSQRSKACRAKLLVQTERCALLTTNVLVARVGVVICHRNAVSSAVSSSSSSSTYTNEEESDRKSDRKLRQSPPSTFSIFILVIQLFSPRRNTRLSAVISVFSILRALCSLVALPSHLSLLLPPALPLFFFLSLTLSPSFFPSVVLSRSLSLPLSIDRVRPWCNIEEPNRADVHACVRCNYRSCCH